MVRNDILQKFPDLFGAKTVNGHQVNVEDAITTLTRELRPEIAAALTARREILASPAPVRQKYGWPKWEEKFQAVDLSPDRAGIDRQFSRQRERRPLAPQ
jgi:malate synthase